MRCRAPRVVSYALLAGLLSCVGIALHLGAASAAQDGYALRAGRTVTAQITAGSGSASVALAATTRTKRRARRGPPGGVCYARNAIVVDPSNGQVLFQKNAETTVPIASLTKLMTALVFLELEPDLNRSVAVTRAELNGGGHTQLRAGERVRLEDLLYMSLMCSDNVATRVLVRESGLSRSEFLESMNGRASDLGLASTRYVECTGLDERNVSTAADIATVLHVAASNPTIHRITTTRSYEFVSATRPHQIGNTNRLLYSRYEIKGGKTGFISEAGYCFATWVQTGGKDRIAVVLGAPTAATRFNDVVRMLQRTANVSVAAEVP